MNKLLYKLLLVSLKILPMTIAFGYMLNSVLSYTGIDVTILSYICGMSLLPLIFMYISSYVFNFCKYHRMFLHYIVITDSINLYDYYIGIPLSDRVLFVVDMIIACIVLFIVLYLYIGNKKHDKRNKEITRDNN